MQVHAECGEVKYDANDDDNLDELDSMRGRRRRQSYYQPINPIPESEEQSRYLHIPDDSRLGYDPLSKGFSVEMRCLDLFEEVISSIPDLLCYLGKGTTSTNVDCWTGSTLLLTGER